MVVHRKPLIAARVHMATPADTDEFNAPRLGLQWAWQANPMPGWAFPSASLGVLRLQNVPVDPSTDGRLWTTSNVLTQKLPGPSFTVTTKLSVNSQNSGDRSGLVLLGLDYAYVGVRRTSDGLQLVFGECHDADKGSPEVETNIATLPSNTVFLRMSLARDAEARFSYSADGVAFTPVGTPFHARQGTWIGARVGLFAQGLIAKGEHGYTDVDWFRFAK